MWLSTLGTLGKSWGGPTRQCCVLSAHTSDSCSWGPRPGRRLVNLWTGFSLTSYLAVWVCKPAGTFFPLPKKSSSVELWRILCLISSWDLLGNVPSHGVFAESGMQAPIRCSPRGTGGLLMTCHDQRDTWLDGCLVWWWRTPSCVCACGRPSCSFTEVNHSEIVNNVTQFPKSQFSKAQVDR